jgi:hypothetical protein
LVDLLRQVLERQALRRVEGSGLSEEQVDRMGVALMELEEKMAELRTAFGLSEEDLFLDLGPLGRLSWSAMMPDFQRRASALPSSTSLVDILDRVLDKGLVVAGDIRISLANIELLTVRIRLLVCSIDKAAEIGLDWWRRDGFLSSTAAEQAEATAALQARVAALEQLLAAAAETSAEPGAAPPRRPPRRRQPGMGG